MQSKTERAGNCGCFERERERDMENSSSTLVLKKLCENLIGLAFGRCRISDNICRLSIVLTTRSRSRSSTQSDHPPILHISISDTGLGSCLEELQDLLHFPTNITLCVIAAKWDGVLSVTTTSICDAEVYHYLLNLKENDAARRLTMLPPTPKNGRKFSGTEISLSTYERMDDLLAGVIHFLRKMLILKIPKVAVEVVVDHTESSGSGREHIFLANESISSLSLITNIDRLESGLEDYVLKHGNTLEQECQSCFSSREHVKLGSGTTCSSEDLRSTGQVIEVVIIITELPEPASPSCMKACGTTEVLFFQEFLPCTIPQSSLNALTSFDWKSYGLSLRTNDMGENGHLMLTWENLPPYSHIDIVIHCYNRQITMPQVRRKIQVDRNLVKKAIKLAMDDLKEKYAGILLSAQALKVQSYAPDLARTIAGLIFSSNDLQFQGECISLLGMQHQGIDKEKVESCIRKKITHVIELNDRKPTSRESVPVLFEDESIPDTEFQDEDGGEEDFDILGL